MGVLYNSRHKPIAIPASLGRNRKDQKGGRTRMGAAITTEAFGGVSAAGIPSLSHSSPRVSCESFP